MSRPLWSNHNYIYTFRRHNVFEMNIKAVTKTKSLSGYQIRSNFVFIYFSLELVRYRHDDKCSAVYCGFYISRLKAVLYRKFVIVGFF